MYIKRLFIKNYRCFGENPTIIEFSDSGLTALIGPNNVGKSTVLKALDILLGDKWPMARFNEDDFYHNKLNGEIVLACEFKNPMQIIISGSERNIYGVVINAKHLSTGYGESSVNVEYRLLDKINSFVDEGWEIAGYGGYSNKPVYIGQEIKNQLPICITIPLIKLHAEQPTNKWGVLGRMLQKIERSFITEEGNEKKFKDKIKGAVDLLRQPKEFKEIEKHITKLWEEIRPANLSGTQLEFLDYEPWRYYRQFKLAIKRNDKEVPIETLGEGVQRLAIIAIYRTYLRKHGRGERAILLIEEPESYLHPQARRLLFSALKEAIKKGSEAEGQIVYTTHSSDFIDCGNFENICLLWQDEDTQEITAQIVTQEMLNKHAIALGAPENSINKGNPQIYYRLVETVTTGLKDALFSTKAIIVEGASEIELFRFFSDTEKEQIAIVSSDGKGMIPSVYTFLTAFGVPCLIVMDRDEDSGENEKVVNALTQCKAKNTDVSLKDISGVKDGEIKSFRRILIFGKNLEAMLSQQIKGYQELIKEIQNKFGLPSDKDKRSKPREIQVLGLLYQNQIDNNEQYKQLKQKFEEGRADFDSLKKALNKFVNQKVGKSGLLNSESINDEDIPF